MKKKYERFFMTKPECGVSELKKLISLVGKGRASKLMNTSASNINAMLSGLVIVKKSRVSAIIEGL